MALTSSGSAQIAYPLSGYSIWLISDLFTTHASGPRPVMVDLDVTIHTEYILGTHKVSSSDSQNTRNAVRYPYAMIVQTNAT